MSPNTVDLAPLGFRKTPFTRELSIGEHFCMPQLQAVVDALFCAISQRSSAALIASAGTGKTVALRALVKVLPEARYDVRYVKITGLSKRDLCKEVAAACGLSPAGTYPTLVRRLQDAFGNATNNDGLRPVLILDEAHDLRPDSLAMFRLLTNFEMDSRLVLSVLLSGQPQLRKMLAHPGQQALAQRLVHYATLRLLSREETQAYITHRCLIAGCQQPPIDVDAIEAVFEMSRGNMRAIDRLMLKALERAAGADATTVSVNEVIAARQYLLP